MAKQVGGKEKKESRAERRARVAAEAKAREQCFKILPAVVGVILILVVGFAVWVRSVPPALVTPTISPEILEQLKQQFADSNNNKADLKFTAPSDGDGSGKVEKEERTTVKATVTLTPKGDTSAEDDVTEL